VDFGAAQLVCFAGKLISNGQSVKSMVTSKLKALVAVQNHHLLGRGHIVAVALQATQLVVFKFPCSNQGNFI